MKPTDLQNCSTAEERHKRWQNLLQVYNYIRLYSCVCVWYSESLDIISELYPTDHFLKIQALFNAELQSDITPPHVFYNHHAQLKTQVRGLHQDLTVAHRKITSV